MPQVVWSPGALAVMTWIGRTDALTSTSEVDHTLDIRGGPFLVGEGSHEHLVADGAIVAIGREPRVPGARDPLRRLPPLLKPLGLPERPLAGPRVALVTRDNVVPRGSVSSRTEEHVPHSEAATDVRSRT